jgi:uncharacterized protein YdcH (DUF465 family)
MAGRENHAKGAVHQLKKQQLAVEEHIIARIVKNSKGKNFSLRVC